MPPKKQQLSRAEFQSLIQDHGIRIKGPVPPKEWPDQYKHHFLAIRQINTIRYDDYKSDRRISKRRTSYFKEQIAMLRERAYHFLDDANTNEATWRELEQPILERFNKRVIW
jgi:hypothetical protein